MTYRSIFVHVDDSEPCALRLDVATRIARAYPARLLGAYLVPSANVMPFASVMLPEEVVQRRLQENNDLQHDAEARFRAAATQAGVTSVDWHAPAGNPLESAILACALCRPRGRRTAVARRAESRLCHRTRQRGRHGERPARAVRPVHGPVQDGRRTDHDRVEGFPRVGARRCRRAAAPQGREESVRRGHHSGRRRQPAGPPRRQARGRVSCGATRSTPSCGALPRPTSTRANCCCRKPPISAPT